MANNVKTLQNAMKWLKRRIREEVKLDGCTSVDHAAELEFIERMLEKFPLRQCDVGTAEEQAVRFRAMCNKYYCDEYECDKNCPLASLDIIHGFPRCQSYWAQMPYEAKEGAGK